MKVNDNSHATLVISQYANHHDRSVMANFRHALPAKRPVVKANVLRLMTSSPEARKGGMCKLLTIR